MGILVLLVIDDVWLVLVRLSWVENKDDEKYKRLSMFFKRIKKLLESESLGIFKWVVLERNLFWFMEWIEIIVVVKKVCVGLVFSFNGVIYKLYKKCFKIVWKL